jgi:hypothetical protein
MDNLASASIVSRNRLFTKIANRPSLPCGRWGTFAGNVLDNGTKSANFGYKIQKITKNLYDADNELLCFIMFPLGTKSFIIKFGSQNFLFFFGDLPFNFFDIEALFAEKGDGY